MVLLKNQIYNQNYWSFFSKSIREGGLNPEDRFKLYESTAELSRPSSLSLRKGKLKQQKIGHKE